MLEGSASKPTIKDLGTADLGDMAKVMSPGSYLSGYSSYEPITDKDVLEDNIRFATWGNEPERLYDRPQTSAERFARHNPTTDAPKSPFKRP